MQVCILRGLFVKKNICKHSLKSFNEIKRYNTFGVTSVMSLKEEPTVHVLNIKFYAICNDHNNIHMNGYACVSNDNLTKYQYAISPTS